MIYNHIHKLRSPILKETQWESVFSQVIHPLITVINKNYKEILAENIEALSTKYVL